MSTSVPTGAWLSTQDLKMSVEKTFSENVTNTYESEGWCMIDWVSSTEVDDSREMESNSFYNDNHDHNKQTQDQNYST